MLLPVLVNSTAIIGIHVKKQVLIALLACASILPAAQAADDYVGLNIGRVGHKGTFEGTGSDKDSDVGYRIYFGHQINQTWGLEVGYADLGEYKLSDSGVTLGAAPRSLQGALTATFPLSNQFSLFGKAGFSQNKTEVRVNGKQLFKENDTNTLFGIGASFALNQKFTFVVEYENYSKVLDAKSVHLKTNVISGGVRYFF